MTALAAAVRRAARPSLDGWTVAAAAVAALVAVPLATIAYRAIDPADDTWSHLAATVLPVYVSNTLWLLLGVGAGTIVVGASTAWLVTMYRFPGRRVLSWALLLPLAVPSYVLAFVVTDQLEYAGPVQAALREAFGWTSARDYWFPEIRSLGGAAIVLSLVLYPYVYLLARAAFIEQCFCLFEASRTLGRGPARSFFAVALPMARPGVAVGAALALMETLNEFGTVDFFAVPTFTAGIFDVWLNMDSPAGASQLALALVVFTLALLAIRAPGAAPGPRLRHDHPRPQAPGVSALARRGRRRPRLVRASGPARVRTPGRRARGLRDRVPRSGARPRILRLRRQQPPARGRRGGRHHRPRPRPRLRRPALAAARHEGHGRGGDRRLRGPGGGPRGRPPVSARRVRQRRGRALPGALRGLHRPPPERDRRGARARLLGPVPVPLLPDPRRGPRTGHPEHGRRRPHPRLGARRGPAARPLPPGPAEPARRGPARLRRHHEGAAAHPAHAPLRLRDPRDLRVPARVRRAPRGGARSGRSPSWPRASFPWRSSAAPSPVPGPATGPAPGPAEGGGVRRSGPCRA